MNEFLDRLAAKRAVTAEANWMICQCQEGIDPPAGWYVGVVHDSRGPIVAELLCMACEASSSVLNGRPEPDDDE